MYKRQIDSTDNFYNDSYWLTYPGYAHALIVCKNDFLREFEDVKTYPPGEGAIVKFEGQLKSICGETPAPWIYDLITLTKLERYEYDSTSCGCSSTVWKVVPELTPLYGLVKFKRQQNPFDSYYNNRYWITYTEPNCVNCIHTLIVCNDEIMVGFEHLLDSESSDTIRFAGQLRKVCMYPYASLADYTYDQITLTKIEKQ